MRRLSVSVCWSQCKHRFSGRSWCCYKLGRSWCGIFLFLCIDHNVGIDLVDEVGVVISWAGYGEASFCLCVSVTV